MTLEERAAAIAYLAGPNSAARGTLREKRVYAKALRMLREACDERETQVLHARAVRPNEGTAP